MILLAALLHSRTTGENFVLIMYHERTIYTRENSQKSDKIFIIFQQPLCADGQSIQMVRSMWTDVLYQKEPVENFREKGRNLLLYNQRRMWYPL